MNAKRKHHILVVDNDPLVVAMLTARLEGMGHVCHAAASGNDGLALFDERSFDLVISDLNMPNGDGLVLASGIRRRSRVPLILVSGFKDAYRRWLRDIADVTFVHKPFDSRELTGLVQDALLRADAGEIRTHQHDERP